MSPHKTPRDPRPFDQVHLYIMDFRNEDEDGLDNGIRTFPTTHQLKCDTMSEFFEARADAKIHKVRFEKGTKMTGVLKYWENEMAAKSADELVIVYYHGAAGVEASTNDDGEEGTYRWSFNYQGYPKSPINAEKLVKTIDGHQPHVLFLLDCDVPTRFPKKFVRRVSNTEIIGAGGFVTTCKGKEVQEGLGDFTYSTTRNLRKFMNGIDTKFKRYKKLTSIPRLMRADRKLWNNPKRIWLDKTRAGREELVERIMICPKLCRERGVDGVQKLKFVSVVIQGSRAPAEDVDASDGSSETINPEGFDTVTEVGDDASEFEDEGLVGDLSLLDEQEDTLFC